MEIPQELKDEVYEKRNELGCCPLCNGNIKDRTVTIYASLIQSLYKVYCWCGEKRVHEFKMSDIRHFLDHNDYSRFNNLVRFGGILYRPEKDAQPNSGLYGINMGRARAFFKGEYKIPMQIVLDQINDKRIAATYVSIHEIPDLLRLLSKDGVYDYEKILYTKVDYQKQQSADLPPVEEYKESQRLF